MQKKKKKKKKKKRKEKKNKKQNKKKERKKKKKKKRKKTKTRKKPQKKRKRENKKKKKKKRTRSKTSASCFILFYTLPKAPPAGRCVFQENSCGPKPIIFRGKGRAHYYRPFSSTAHLYSKGAPSSIGRQLRRLNRIAGARSLQVVKPQLPEKVRAA